jgi:hypothetical protein
MQAAHKARTRLIAHGAKRGLDEETLSKIEASYVMAALTAMNDMGLLAAAIVPPAWDALDCGFMQVRDRMSDDLSRFLRDEARWAPTEARQKCASFFYKMMDGTGRTVVDDLRHGRMFVRPHRRSDYSAS